MENFDVIIVGSGPSGMFCAYELISRNPKAKILILEEGKKLSERKCPITEKKTSKCVKCPVCAITHGSSGAGAFSDGKLLLPHKSDRNVRGNLGRLLTLSEAQELYNYTDGVYLGFGAATKVDGEEGPAYIENTLKPFLNLAGLKANCSRIRHLGTDGARQVYQNVEDWLLERGVEIHFNTTVKDIIVQDDKVTGVKVSDSASTSNSTSDSNISEFKCAKVVLAVGRSGTDWLEEFCKKHGIKYVFGSADIGVRYELPDVIMKDINTVLYEGKFIGYTNQYKDRVRTFCQNPSGIVSAESYRGELTLVNGHSFLEPASDNTNLSLLVSIDGLKDPIETIKNLARSINSQGNGQPIVQRLEDLKNGRATTPERLAANSVIPTLRSAIPSDIASVLPYRIVLDLLGFIDAMNIVAPGFSGDENLLYAPEIKFYNLMISQDKNCMTNIQGLYGIGDGAGPTHGLMPASVNGVYLGRILARLI